MRTSIIVLASGFMTGAWSQGPGSASNFTESAPFGLVLRSSNTTLDGVPLAAIHDGAAIETLAASIGGVYDGEKRYNLNFTFMVNKSVNNTLTPGFDPAINTPGWLKFFLSEVNEPESLIETDRRPESNVGSIAFHPTGNSPGSSQTFDRNGVLVRPSVAVDGYSTEYRWYICLQRNGYTREVLAWVNGNEKPDNPTCHKVDVIRKML